MRLALAILFLLSACAHQTAMNDRQLQALWNGTPLSDEALMQAKHKWPLDVTLIDMQEGTNLLRQGDLNAAEVKRTQTYLTDAFNTFDDLKEPANFSKAFTTDSQTPYRGRPFERMMSATLLALLDASQGRCDMAIPALKAAEFLDARWQPFVFGTDAPLIYALLLRCSDQPRTRDGLYRSLRMQMLLETLIVDLALYAHENGEKSPSVLAAMAVAEVGVASALLVADPHASIDAILEVATRESLLFLVKALKENEAPYADILKPLMRKVREHEVEQAFETIWHNVLARGDSRLAAEHRLAQVDQIQKQILTAVRSPTMVVYLTGTGPTLKREGQYNEIARIVPSSEEDAKAGVQEVTTEIALPCGVSNHHGNTYFVLCHTPQSRVRGNLKALKLWSSSFQATTTVGRRFDQILKGRAQFRMGTEITAMVGGYAALALLNASSGMRGKDAERMQTAALVVGAIAGAAWLAGRASNPEADIRFVQHNFESGYLLLP